MLAAMAPIPELLDELSALEPVMDAFFDDLPDDYVAEFHCGAMVSGIVAQINWLFDLVLHGEDVARSVGVPWEIRERDMLLLLREGLEVAPAYLSATVAPTTDICVALQIPDARPYVVHVHDGIAESRPRRPSDRPDAVMKVPASTMVRLLLQRIGPFTAALQGLRIGVDLFEDRTCFGEGQTRRISSNSVSALDPDHDTWPQRASRCPTISGEDQAGPRR